MIELFEKFTGNKVLHFFVFNARKEIHVNALARELKISVSTAKTYCDVLHKENILLMRQQGNQKVFFLNNNYYLVKEIKRAFALFEFKSLGIEQLVGEKAHSFAIYGSFASGEFDERSDLDLLVIGERMDVDFRELTKFEQLIKREIQVTIYKWYKWRTMEKEKNPFVDEVQRKHIMIRGVQV